MKKTTVFLDWINTLVRMEPDRHMMCVAALKEVGIELDPQDALRGVLAAEQQMPQGRPIQWTESQDPAVFLRYNEILMRSVGLEALDAETTMAVVRKVREMAQRITFSVFPDVKAMLEGLKGRGITVAVLSNMNRPLQPMLERLGLSEAIAFSITSSEVAGTGKPEEPIFREALTRAGAQPEQALHVGDEPWVDGRGAQAVGITPVIIDRWGLFSDNSDYAYISSLHELPPLLDTFA